MCVRLNTIYCCIYSPYICYSSSNVGVHITKGSNKTINIGMHKT